MGHLLDTFEKIVPTLEWKPNVMFEGSLILTLGDYAAHLHRWKDQEWRVSVRHTSWGHVTTLTEHRVPLDDLEVAKATALEGIRTHVRERDFVMYGAARLNELEREVAALREQLQTLQREST